MRAARAVIQVAVREHDALRPAGRAAGVHERGQVIVTDADDVAGRGGLKLGEVHPANVPGKRGRPAADDDHVPQLRRSRRRGGHRGQQLGRRHHRHGTGVGQDVRQLGRADQEHHRGDHRPRPPDRAVGDAYLRAVRHQDHYPLAGRHAQLHQPRCRPAGPVEQLARPVRPALENEALVVAEPVERRLGQRGKVVVNLRRRHARPPRSARLPDGNAGCEWPGA